MSSGPPTAPADAAGEVLHAPFRIVGVGASAGGLAAVTQLLRGLGPEPGCAIVLVQHLDPTHASNLVELLGRVTPLPVEAVRDGTRVEVDHVYVIPPGVDMSITQGVLHLSPRAAPSAGVHLPIDAFFASLAQDRGERVAGVVLSGTGSDGSRGVEAIKAEGGVTFAQEGAEHAGMPESAVATGVVDFVLPVEDIAVELRRIAAEAPGVQVETPDEARAYHRILAAIRQGTGVDFAHYKTTTLHRRIVRRAGLRRAASLPEYADVVAAEPAEVDALCEEMLIHVTSFFRDAGVFEALKAAVLSRLLSNRGADAPIRCWVPGCATGEEVYSIAICLLELLEEARASRIPVKIFGTDVSRRAIERARAGAYPESIAEDVGPTRLARFFRKTERGYEVQQEVRDCCVFATHDVARDPPFSKIDLVSCRNLMIYLGAALQGRIMQMFHYALNEHGLLLLGTAETVGTSPGFTAVDAKNRIYARGPGPAHFEFAESRGWPVSRQPPAHPAERPGGASDVAGAANRAILAVTAPVGVVVTDGLVITEFRGDVAPYVGPVPGVATLDLLRMAREGLRVPLRRAIDEARESGKPARAVGVMDGSGEPQRQIDIDIVPFNVPFPNGRFFAVLFTERAAPRPAEAGPVEETPRDDVEESLRQELSSTRLYLQSVVEQLEAGNEEQKAANEELLSSNEELQSTNEELQTAKEELQATNEELRTVNDELLDRNAQAGLLTDDLTNILSSLAIPMIILDGDSRIRRFTPTATTALSIIATDVGRPITDIRAKMPIPDLPGMIADVTRHLTPVERSVVAEDGRWYQVRIRPYRTLSNRIDGTVITVYDVDALKKTELLLAETRDDVESVLDAMRDPLIVVDGDLRVRSVNRAFCRLCGITAEEIVGRMIDEGGHAPGLCPPLRPLFEKLLHGERVEDVRLNHDFPTVGHRTLIASGRRTARTGRILLTLADVTERTDAERRVNEYQAKLQRMIFQRARAEERERRRIAQDLHDQIGQALALARMKLEAARDSATGDAGPAIRAAVGLISSSIEDVRTLTFELAPPILYDLGLEPALSWLCAEIEKQSGVHVVIVKEGEGKAFDEATSALIFRTVRELLLNVVKHGQTSAAWIALKQAGDVLEVAVYDEGAGFDTDDVSAASNGFGLFGVREQIARLGGTVDIQSKPGHGSRVTLRIPNETRPGGGGRSK